MLTKEQIITDMKIKGNPFMARFKNEGAVFYGTNDELEILMICAIESRTETLNEQLEWIDEMKKVIEAKADLDCDF